MRPARRDALWALCGLAAAWVLPALFHRAYPFTPKDWAITAADARQVALERARDLGDIPVGAIAVARLAGDATTRSVCFWQVDIVPPGVSLSRALFEVRVGPAGDVLSLERRTNPPRPSLAGGAWGRGGVTGDPRRFVMILLAVAMAGLWFRRRRRSTMPRAGGRRILWAALSGGTLAACLGYRSLATRAGLAGLTLRQSEVVGSVGFMVSWVLPAAVISMWSWRVGGCLAGGSETRPLAAFESVLRGQWRTVDVARAVLRGLSAGLILLALTFGVVLALRSTGARPLSPLSYGRDWASAHGFGVALVASQLPYALVVGLCGHLLLVSAASRAWGTRLGTTVAIAVGAFAFYPILSLRPFAWNIPLWLGASAVLVVLYLRYGVLTSLLAYATPCVLIAALPFARAPNPTIQFQGLLPMLLLALPLIVSVRWLASPANE